VDELLAASVNPLIGRQAELASLRAALAAARLVTVTGPGGVGKTRLALAALEGHRDRVVTAELVAVLEPAQLVAFVLAACGVRPQPGADVFETLASSLMGRRTVLLLDNCEHVREEAASVCAGLLLAAPELHIVATSRVPLEVPGEATFELAPLSLGAGGDAVALFVDRARRASRFFVCDDEALSTVEGLCAELDGLPLAIELAAARTRMLDIGQISADLGRRLDLLAGGRKHVPRHRSLRASVQWSAGLLSEAERALFERLSVFAGGWQLAGAEEVCARAPIPAADVLDLLGALVDWSLVAVDRSAPETRFRMLRTINADALERLEARGDAEATRAAHAAWCAALVERAERQMIGGEQSEALSTLDREADNVRAALIWTRTADPALGARIASSMALYWHVRGRFIEGRHELAGLLREPDTLAPEVRARANWALGLMLVANGELAAARTIVQDALLGARSAGAPGLAARALILMGELDLMNDPAAAQEPLEQAVALARQTNDPSCLADALGKLGAAALYRSEATAARPPLEESLAIARQAGDERSMHRALGGLARVAAIEDDVERAIALLSESLDLSHRLGDRSWIALDLAMLGELERLAGRPREGEVLARRGLALAEEIGSRYARYMASGLLGRILLTLGDVDDAADCFAAALDVSDRDGPTPFQSWWHLGLGEVELARGDPAAAATRARAALAAAETIGNRRDAARARMMLGLAALAGLEPDVAVAYLTDALTVQREIEDDSGARRSLQALRAAFAASGQHERAERIDAALARSGDGVQEAAALALRGRGARRRDGAHGWAGLTGAEAEVAELAAAGVSNPEIATRLYMSRSTVKTHLSRVYIKLSVGNRTELAAAVARLRPPTA
jgi:predicted ATPase/DNA-binding CsgD family transcriptional regulator